MQSDRSTSRFLGSILFRGLSVALFLVMVAAFFVANPAGGFSQEPLTVRVAVPAEAFEWVKQAAEEFDQTSQRVGGQVITVDVSSYTVRGKAIEDVQQSLGGSAPYSSVILENFPGTATSGPVYTSAAYGPAPVARTYVIGVIRGEYAEALTRQLGRSDLSIADFQALFDPNAPAGSPVLQVNSGRPRWGAVASEDDYDGPAALYALAAGLKRSGNPRLSDPALETQLKSFYATSPQSRATFDLLGDDMAKFGPTGPSSAMVSEVAALRSAESLLQKGQSLRLIYPPNGLEQRLEYYIIASDKVSSRQRDAAVKFRQFLLGKEVQVDAAGRGLRPADGSAPVAGGGDIWQRLAPVGAQPAYQPSLVQPGERDWVEAVQLVNRLVTE